MELQANEVHVQFIELDWSSYLISRFIKISISCGNVSFSVRLLIFSLISRAEILFFPANLRRGKKKRNVTKKEKENAEKHVDEGQNIRNWY